MKVLVTGGAGFIGSHVVDAYIEAGYEVVVVDDLSSGMLENLNPLAKFYQLDIRSGDLGAIFDVEKPDIVNHHAAQIDVRRSVADPIFDADVNIKGSLNLIEHSRRTGVRRFIYISSGGAVYGEPQYLPCDEKHPINPICPYGASKYIVEHYLFMYREMYGLDYSVLRYANVYGPRQDPHGEAGVVAIFSGQMLSGEQAVINGDGQQTRDFVYVSDCARANLILTEKKAVSSTYNFGSGVRTSISEIYDTLSAITGYQRSPVFGLQKMGETRHIYLSAEKAVAELGWRPLVSLDEGLHRTVDFFRTK